MALPVVAASLMISVLMLMRIGTVEGFDSVLLEGFYMGPNQEICEFPFTFKMQKDCNLVLYLNNIKPMWATNTMDMGKDCFFVLQDDGNGVLWTGDGQVLWQTNTANMNNGPHFLKVQCDGNVVMYNIYGYPLWATDTNVSRLALKDLQLVYNSTHSAESQQDFVPPKFVHTVESTKTQVQ